MHCLAPLYISPVYLSIVWDLLLLKVEEADWSCFWSILGLYSHAIASLDEKPDPNKPFSLGPKISDWDEQRAEWLRKNPNFPNFIGPNKPRVLLVTGSSPKPCENPVGDHYLLKSIKNKIDYCRLHGIEIFYNMALLDAEMAGFWAKLPLIRKLLLSHPEIEFLWWMDSDAMFTDMAFELPWERYKDSNFVMHGWNEMVYDQKNWIGLNTGSFLLRNCQWSLDILDAWAPMGPKGKIREEAGKVLTRELKDRPVFEADDQSAMVYLLATQSDKWGDKVYLESAYYLHGYWGILVDRYEEMIENYHPGLGDHRWPLVTHFVGCKPCGKFGDYPVERCLKQMDRAFNFGDNQILQMYGFTHKSLASRRVKRVRNETSNPLEVKDELGCFTLHSKLLSYQHHLDSQASPVVARYSADNGVVELRFLSESDATDFIDVDLSTAQLFKLGPDRSVCIYEDLASDTSKEAGAKHVYAVEASEMAEYAHKLIAGNPSLGERITVIKGKVKEVELPEKADILISEPMGTLLVNERMLESYVIARDQFLLPSGKMFPTVGRIHVAPFSDEYLFFEIANKALFWQQQNYYRVDLTPVYGSAFQGCFSQDIHNQSEDLEEPDLIQPPSQNLDAQLQ
ncbi:hypothetical protein GH714_018795 [Hevea brasiliensis]|uniref:xyloglucan 6-xylosyltransferase n=1 Tax=Hevea brasiliensis TaxID=3981 RepID=A0A6A6MF05_HEVBR|nr:hypothetical protein GH714_018795 [Hevea brasiliensis]